MSTKEIIPPYGPGYDPSGPKLEGWQVARVAANAGFNDAIVPGHSVSNLVMAVAIAKRESGWIVNIQNGAGFDAWGLWQFHLPAHPEISRACATQAWCAAQQAWRLSTQGTKFFGPWEYPPVQDRIDEATAAVAEMRRLTERTTTGQEELMSLTVIDFKNKGTPAGRYRFVQLVPDNANKRFKLYVKNGAKIGHAASAGLAVTQPSNGKVLGIEPQSDGVHFVVTADDGGTFGYAFAK